MVHRLAHALLVLGVASPALAQIPVDLHPAVPKLVPAWQTPASLAVPESVLWDPAREVLYVSNINGAPTEKNGEGFIARLGLDGTILTRQWVTGLDAPKGMGLAGGLLHVTDIDRVRVIDVDTATIVRTVPVPGARFLNDIAVATDGTVYVSDSSAASSVVYRLVGDQVEPWIGDGLASPNGLLMDGDRLLVGSSGDGRLKAVDLASGEITDVAEVGTSIDGLVSDEKGAWIVSDWAGRISWVSPNGSVIELLDTTADGINAADFELVHEHRLLLVPTFSANRVTAFELR